MSELLTPDKIAALVDAAKQGQLPDAGAPQKPSRRGHRLRTVDFSRPTKFTADQARRIMRAIETFCQTADTRLSTELRVPVELELLNTVQLTWAAAQAQLAAELAVADPRGRADRHPHAADRRAVVRPGRPRVRCWAARRSARPRSGASRRSTGG